MAEDPPTLSNEKTVAPRWISSYFALHLYLGSQIFLFCFVVVFVVAVVFLFLALQSLL